MKMTSRAPFAHLRLASHFSSPRSTLELTSRWNVTVRCLMSERVSNKGSRHLRKKRISGIWYIPSPSTTDPATIIPKLPQLALGDRQMLRKALFLVSPGLAPWFDKNSDFLQNAINWMYAPVIPELTPTSCVAIVDGLPAPEYFEEWNIKGDRPHALAEGIALCLMDNLVALPTGNNSNRVGILEIASQVSDLERRRERSLHENGILSTVTVPMANTLFVNGLPHTAFKVKWDVAENGRSLVPKYGRTPLDFIRYSVAKAPRHAFDHTVPLLPLTTARKVISTMGNVVREVEGDDGKPIKASAELEAVVPEFLAQHSVAGEDTQIKVFARVMPPVAVDTPDTTGAQPDAESLPFATISEDSTSWRRTDYGQIHSTLWAGGRFYRVTGGGGGWGKKAGLLSLDPATNFDAQKETESSLFPDPDDMDSTFNSAAEAGALVPSGHTIQFFAAKVCEPYPPYFEANPDHDYGSPEIASHGFDEWSNLESQKLIVGTQATDDMPRLDSPAPDARSVPVRILPGRFGAMSVGGASLAIMKRIPTKAPESVTTTQPWVTHFQYVPMQEFRIDAPFAMFQSYSSRFKPLHSNESSRWAAKYPHKVSRPNRKLPPQDPDKQKSWKAFNEMTSKPSFRKVHFSPEPLEGNKGHKQRKNPKDFVRLNIDASQAKSAREGKS